MGEIVRVGGRPRRHAGEFASDGLAENHRAGRAHERDASGVGRRPMPAIDRRAHFGRQVGGVDDVLDADRHAVERTTGGAAVERPRLAQRKLGIDRGPGVNCLLALADARQAIAQHRLAGQLAGPSGARDLGGRERVQTRLGRDARYDAG